MNKHLTYYLLLALLSLVVPSTSFAQVESVETLSGEDIAEANRIALADEMVQDYIAGKNYSLMSYGSSGNERTESGVSNVILTYSIENKDQLIATVDLQNKAVVDIQYLADFMPTFVAPVEAKEHPIVNLLYRFLPLLIVSIVGVSAIITIILLRKKRKQAVTN